MGILDSLLGFAAPIGQSFLQAELQRKSARAAAKLQLSMPLAPRTGQQFPALGAPAIKQPLPGGGTVQLAIPSGLSNRDFKTAICRAVKQRLVHPATATAELKIRGMKGCVRRMNPLNPRALTRSARRMEGFLRAVKRIEKALPTKTRRRSSPSGHTHALQSTGVVRNT